jgi:predicted ribosome quality control (RQC) complex YloA/Tae2 family protein
MHFDALTLACIAQELQETIVGGRVQQVMLVDDFSVGLEIYADRQRHYLLISAQPTESRILLSSRKLRRGADQQSPLLLLLRKYVRGSRVAAVRQPDPQERVLRIELDHADYGATTLLTEPMGRSANLILLDPDDRILESVRRVHAHEGRIVLPNQSYTAPPPQQKLPPVDDGSPDYYAQLSTIAQSDDLLWKTLVRQIAGVSPSQAREVAWRAAGTVQVRPSDVNLLAIMQAFQELWSPLDSGNWQPGVWVDDGTVVGFSAYPAHFRGRFEPTQSMSNAIERYFDAKQEGNADAYAVQRREIAVLLRRAIKRVDRRIDALAKDVPQPGEVDHIRSQAEWLLAMSSQIEPGQTMLEVDLGDEMMQIPLDVDRTPVEQAERHFQRARKLERAAKFAPKRRAKLKSDRAYLDQLQVDLSMAESQPEIAGVREELRAMNLLSSQQQPGRKQRSTPAGQPLRFDSREGFEILVGKNARQNEKITFGTAHSDDFWLHIRGMPGAHVVVRRRGSEVDDETLEAAAQLAAFYSKARGERNAEVMVTRRRAVNRIAGGRPGQVSVRNEETITVPAILPETVNRVD